MITAGRKHFTNKPEDLAACSIESNGFKFSKRGYPDFTVYNQDGSIYGFIEVKPDIHHPLKEQQQTFLDFCTDIGVPCIRWSPDEGEEKIKNFLERN